MATIHNLATIDPILRSQIYSAVSEYKPASCLFFEDKLFLQIFAKRDFDPIEKGIISDGLSAIADQLELHYEAAKRIREGVK